jgi:K+-sensing histidine kinase KdpD
MMLVTQVRDSGKGIEEERQKFLFSSFSELMKFQSIEKVKDYGIGIGLSNSRELARKIGGDVILLKS